MEAVLVPTVKMLKASVAGSSLLALSLLMLMLLMMEVVRKLARLLQSALQSVMKILVVVLMQNVAIMVVPVEGVPPLFNKVVWLLDSVKCVVWKSLLLKLSSPMVSILLYLLMVNTYLNFATDVLIMLSVLLMELIAFGPILLVNVLKSALLHLRPLTHVMLILPVHVSVFLIVSVVGANMKRHTLMQQPRTLSLSPLVVACITTWPTNVLNVSKLQDMRVH